MRISTIIFDMDETIIKSRYIWDKIIASFVGQENINYFRESRKLISGDSFKQTCIVLNQVFNIKRNDEELKEIYKKTAIDLFENNSVLFVDGFLNFHKEIISNGMQTALATNAPYYVLDIIKKRLKLEYFFGEHIYSSSDVRDFCKPDPAVFIYALKKLAITPQECLIFEDSPEGIQAAKQIGALCIGINSDNNENSLDNADLIVNNYEELNLQFLLKTFNSSYY